MGEPVSQDGVWAECERIGELEVIQRIAPAGIWGNASISQFHPHAQSWLRAQQWKRQQETEKAVRRAQASAWLSATAAVVSALTALAVALLKLCN